MSLDINLSIFIRYPDKLLRFYDEEHRRLIVLSGKATLKISVFILCSQNCG